MLGFPKMPANTLLPMSSLIRLLKVFDVDKGYVKPHSQQAVRTGGAEGGES